MAINPNVRQLTEAELYAPDLDDDGNLDPETFPLSERIDTDDPYLQEVWREAVEELGQEEDTHLPQP